MGKRRLLLVDGDARSLRVLEVSLKKAGFQIVTAGTGREALDKARAARPELILSDIDMPGMDGFELCREIKADPELSRVPFVFLTGQSAIESKIRGLELGVDEYLTKPIYIKEILTRIRILLQKKGRTSVETRRDPNTRFAGTLHDMGVVDLIQTIEVSRKSGLIHFAADGRQATIYFRNGAVIDAEAGHLQGADAVYRVLTWTEGEFELLFRTVRRKDAIETPTPILLVEGLRRLDEWRRLLEQIPPLTTRFEVDVEELAEQLAEVPDELNRIVRLFDGRRSLLDVIDLAGVGDLECVQLVSRLLAQKLLREAEDLVGDSTGDVGTELSVEGWLGRQLSVAGTPLPLDPPFGEIAAVGAKWNGSEIDSAAERSWPAATLPDAVAMDPEESPTPPSGTAVLRFPAVVGPDAVPAHGEGFNMIRLGRVRLVRRRLSSPDGYADPAEDSVEVDLAVTGAPLSSVTEAPEAAAPAEPALATGSDPTRSPAVTESESEESEAEPGPESEWEPGSEANSIGAASQALPPAAAAAVAFSMAASGSYAQIESIIESEFGPGDVADFDISDLSPTPLPIPVPLGDERPTLRVKSSLGAEVATVSGELAAVVWPPRGGTGEAGRDLVIVAPRRGEHPNGPRPIASGTPPPENGGPFGPVGYASNGRLRSVEVDQELTAAAEIIELATRRRAARLDPPARESSPVPAFERSEERPYSRWPRRSRTQRTHRISSLRRIAGGRSFVRTFVVTVAGALLVGACLGLLFWWLGGRDEGPSGAGSIAPPKAGADELASRAPASQAVATAFEPAATRVAARPEPAGTTRTGTAPSYEELYDEAKRARRHDDFDAVLVYSVRALQQRQTAQALSLQAEALLALGDPSGALPPAETAVSLRPRYAQAWYVKGRIHRALSQTDLAREAFKAYLEIAPDGPRADQVLDFLQDM